MSQREEYRRALQDARLNVDSDTMDRLAAGEEVDLSAVGTSADALSAAASADAADCCGSGWIGFGHKPRFCVKIGNPPKVKICWG